MELTARFRGFLPLFGMMLFLLVSCNETEKPAVAPKTIQPWTFEAVQNAPKIDKYTMKTFFYAPKVGDTAQFKVMQKNGIQRNGLALEQEITQTYTKIIRKINPDGSVEMSIRIDSLIVNEKGPNPQKPGEAMSMQYNSGKSADRKNPDFVQYNSIIGAEVVANVSKFGKVEEVLGLNAIVNQMLGAKKDSIPENMKDQLMQQVKAQFFQLPMQQEYQTFPDDGDSKFSKNWTKVDKIPISGILTVTNTVTYNLGAIHEFNGRKVAIVNAILNATTEIPEKLPRGITFTLKNSRFEGSGKTIVDVETGETMLKSNDVLTKLEASIKDENSGQKQEVNQQINTVVSVTKLR
jgi:hypothetical protein